MSKPLELTIYPRLVEEPNPARWEAWRGWNAQVTREINTRIAKRFTDAELAAEYWAQVHDSQYAMTCELAAEDKPGRKAARRWGAHSDRKAQTLHRFATSPHYFEADQ